MTSDLGPLVESHPVPILFMKRKQFSTLLLFYFLLDYIGGHKWVGAGGYPLDPLTPSGGGPPPHRRPQDKFTLPLLEPPGTIMYIEENFLCKNALKVIFTLSLFDPWRTSLKL